MTNTIGDLLAVDTAGGYDLCLSLRINFSTELLCHMIRKFFHGSTHFVVNHRLSVMCDENHMIGKTVNTMLSPVVPVFLYFVPFGLC